MNPIETNGLTVVYRTGVLGRRHVGLTGLDLQVGEREVFGFIGANGAGKTTTIKSLLGLIRPASGEARLFGLPSGDPASRRDVGFLPEQPYFYEYLTGRETLDFYGRLSGLGRAERGVRAGEVLERVGLSHAADRAVRGYSRGMRQRLGLAQAIIHRPKLVILDEPMSGLDPLGRRDIRLLISDLAREGTTVFFSSHILSDVESLCDRVGVVAQGRLVASGGVGELSTPKVKAVEVRLKGAAAADFAELGVELSRLREDGGVLTFEVPDLDWANRAARVAMDRGGQVMLLAPVKETLEEVFTRLQDGSDSEAVHG